MLIPYGREKTFTVAKRVSIGYTDGMSDKDSGLRIRLDRALRDQFLQVCRAQHQPAAQVLRQFMREYVAENGNGIGPAGSRPDGSVER